MKLYNKEPRCNIRKYITPYYQFNQTKLHKYVELYYHSISYYLCAIKIKLKIDITPFLKSNYKILFIFNIEALWLNNPQYKTISDNIIKC